MTLQLHNVEPTEGEEEGTDPPESENAFLTKKFVLLPVISIIFDMKNPKIGPRRVMRDKGPGM